MFVLEEPYASRVLVDWLERNGHPVVENGFSRNLVQSGAKLHLVAQDEALERVEGGERLCTNSENALEWVVAHVRDPRIVRGVRMCKDKELMRTTLRELDPQLFFEGVSFEQLQRMSYADLPERLVVKPTVGFCSMGVHAVRSQADWDRAMASIGADAARWAAMYPDDVVGSSRFLVEEAVCGREVALDMFFDDDGTPCIFNVLQHDFAGPDDTSDRLYWCSANLKDQVAGVLEPWLSRAGSLMGLRGFCAHVEVRIDGSRVHAIEFNPLRFAGIGGTDISRYACGMLAYDAYLGGCDPAPFVSQDRYVMSVLMPDGPALPGARFDYEAFASCFSQVLDLRRFDCAKMGAFGMLFLRVAPGEAGNRETDYLLHVDLNEFVK